VEELNFHGIVDCDETIKRLQLQVEPFKVKGVAAKLMINGSSSGTRMFMHGGFMMVKDIFTKVEFVENICQICVRVRL
jgi:hypothetical protein